MSQQLLFPDLEPRRPDAMVFTGLEHYRDYPRPLVMNVSGGRSSAFQAWHFIEAHGGKPGDVIFNFCNTGLEDARTLDFVDRLDRHLGLDVHWLEFDDAEPTKVKRVSYETAARNGEPFHRLLHQIIPKRKDGTPGVIPLPNPAQRTCTAQLKIKTLHRFMRRHLSWPTLYHAGIGYRRDERLRYERRVAQDQKKKTPEGGVGWFPMYQSGAVVDDIEHFFRWAPFDLELDSTFGNCDLCLMLATWKVKERMLLIAMEDQIKPIVGGPIPARIARWIGWEERVSDRPGPFRRDRPTYRQLWHEICRGNLTAVGNGKLGMECLSCTD